MNKKRPRRTFNKSFSTQCIPCGNTRTDSNCEVDEDYQVPYQMSNQGCDINIGSIRRPIQREACRNQLIGGGGCNTVPVTATGTRIDNHRLLRIEKYSGYDYPPTNRRAVGVEAMVKNIHVEVQIAASGNLNENGKDPQIRQEPVKGNDMNTQRSQADIATTEELGDDNFERCDLTTGAAGQYHDVCLSILFLGPNSFRDHQTKVLYSVNSTGSVSTRQCNPICQDLDGNLALRGVAMESVSTKPWGRALGREGSDAQHHQELMNGNDRPVDVDMQRNPTGKAETGKEFIDDDFEWCGFTSRAAGQYHDMCTCPSNAFLWSISLRDRRTNILYSFDSSTSGSVSTNPYTPACQGSDGKVALCGVECVSTKPWVALARERPGTQHRQEVMNAKDRMVDVDMQRSQADMAENKEVVNNDFKRCGLTPGAAGQHHDVCPSSKAFLGLNSFHHRKTNILYSFHSSGSVSTDPYDTICQDPDGNAAPHGVESVSAIPWDVLARDRPEHCSSTTGLCLTTASKNTHEPGSLQAAHKMANHHSYSDNSQGTL